MTDSARAWLWIKPVICSVILSPKSVDTVFNGGLGQLGPGARVGGDSKTFCSGTFVKSSGESFQNVSLIDLRTPRFDIPPIRRLEEMLNLRLTILARILDHVLV